MVGVTVLLLQLSVAILLGANLPEVCGGSLKEVRLIINGEDGGNTTREIEVKIDLDDLPESIADAILRGDYSKITELEKSILAMNESSATDDTLDSMEYRRWKRSIIGIDNRRPVRSGLLSSYPYCAIGYLESGCTAAFIGPRHALTAAHCVVGMSASDLTLYRGQSCSNSGQRMYYDYESYIPMGYIRNTSPSLINRYDYALLLYQQTSPCYLKIRYEVPWQGYGLTVIGYPHDKDAYRLSDCSYNSMYYSECSRSYASSIYRFRYQCDTLGGMSGSPLIALKDGIVYGVHGIGGSEYNYGVRITQTRYYNFLEWIREH